MKPLTSRERVIASLEHRQPDRVPIDLGGNQTGIHVRAYKRVLEFLGIHEDKTVLSHFTQQLACPCDALLDRFNIDTRWVRPLAGYVDLDRQEPQHERGYVGKFDQFHVFWGQDEKKPIEGILYYDPIIHPLADATSVQDIERFAWPDGTDKAPLKGLKEVARGLHEKTQFAVCSTAIGNTFETCTFLFGLVRAMKLVRMNPGLLIAAMNRLLEYWKDYNTTYLAEIGQFLDVACINGDLAGQDGPLINPAFYEKHIKPIDAQLVMHVKKIAPHLKLNYHSCGSVPVFIPHFASIGYTSINPVQVSARDMEPCSLKQRFGKSIAFWGGLCDSQRTLPFGTPEQVRSEVKKNMACFKPNGGFIAANIHNITAEVPAANIIAMFDAASEFGRY
nr:uroporphyrinogen decarboxylase family protein [Candidatus Sigynarchaeota archaeon]